MRGIHVGVRVWIRPIYKQVGGFMSYSLPRPPAPDPFLPLPCPPSRPSLVHTRLHHHLGGIHYARLHARVHLHNVARRHTGL